MLGTAQKIRRAHPGVLCHSGAQRFPAPAGCELCPGGLALPAHRRVYHSHCCCRFPYLEIHAGYRKMVVKERSGQ